MSANIIQTSLTRIADFNAHNYTVEKLAREHWESEDYILGEVIQPGGITVKTELKNGRMIKVLSGDHLVGALGVRHATLEVTGSWENIQEDGIMHSLTAAGIFGKLTSKSIFLPKLIQLKYKGHIVRNGRKVSMSDFVPQVAPIKYSIPTILTIGTSMSAGKTTSARILTGILKKKEFSIVNAKLTGAGRYRDILSVRDAGADHIFDFVDVGLSSTLCNRDVYHERLNILLSMIAGTGADISIIEIGASPQEPYNGDLAYEAIKEYVHCTILCASDPYAAYGIMRTFDIKPDMITGPATNTIAGSEMIEKLCGVKAINIINPVYNQDLRKFILPKFNELLKEAL